MHHRKQVVKEGRQKIGSRGHPWLHSDSEASLYYLGAKRRWRDIFRPFQPLNMERYRLTTGPAGSKVAPCQARASLKSSLSLRTQQDLSLVYFMDKGIHEKCLTLTQVSSYSLPYIPTGNDWCWAEGPRSKRPWHQVTGRADPWPCWGSQAPHKQTRTPPAVSSSTSLICEDNSCHRVQLLTNCSQGAAEASFETACILAAEKCLISVS